MAGDIVSRKIREAVSGVMVGTLAQAEIVRAVRESVRDGHGIIFINGLTREEITEAWQNVPPEFQETYEWQTIAQYLECG